MVNGGRWTEAEHTRFLQGMKLHGRDWRTIAHEVVKTRSQEQVRIHAQKHQQKQEKLKRQSSGKSATNDGHWTDEEHQLFLRSWAKYGKSWKKLSEIMKTRSNEQIRTHAQKYFNKLRELRSRGYDGTYEMDGTRHLTKSFVSKKLPPCSTAGIPVFACPTKRSTSPSTSSRGSKRVKRSNDHNGRPRKSRRVAKDDETSDEEDEAEDEDSQQDWEGDDDDAEDEDDDEMDADGAPRSLGRRLTYTTRSGRIVTANWKEDGEYCEEEGEQEKKEGEGLEEQEDVKCSVGGLYGHHHADESRSKVLGQHGMDLAQSSTTIDDTYEVVEALDSLETCKIYGAKEKSFFGAEDDLSVKREDEEEEDDYQHLDYQYPHPYHHDHKNNHLQMFPAHHSSFQSSVLEDVDEDEEHGSHAFGHLIFGHGDVLNSSTASSMNASLAPRSLMMASSTITEEDAAERFHAEMDEWADFTSGAIPLEL